MTSICFVCDLKRLGAVLCGSICCPCKRLLSARAVYRRVQGQALRTQSFQFVGIVLLLLSCHCAAATTELFVSPKGTADSSCGLSPGNGACRSLQTLVSSSANLQHSLIFIEPAAVPYDCEKVRIAVNVTILSGPGSGAAVYDCADSSYALFLDGDAYTTQSLSNVHFQRCRSTADGGCLRIHNTRNISITGASFAHARGGFNGGAVAVRYTDDVGPEGANIYIANCSFYNTSSINGGALAVNFDKSARSCQLFISQSGSFTRSHAERGGGSISVVHGRGVSNCSLQVDGAQTFTNSTAGAGGGAISLFFVTEATGYKVRIIGQNAFKSVASNESGGAIQISVTSNATNVRTTISGNNTFTNCAARLNGGAVNVQVNGAQSSSVITEIFGANVFDDCISGQNGGAVQLHYQKVANARVEVDGSNEFRNARAGQSGGALSVQYDKKARGCSVNVRESNVFKNGLSGFGGGCLSVVYNDFATNSSALISGRQRFVNCKAGHAGGGVGVYHDASSVNMTLGLSGSNYFAKCDAGTSGGSAAVILTQNIDGYSVDVTGKNSFLSCSSNAGGGCLYFGRSQPGEVVRANFSITGSNMFDNCTAVSHGAAVVTSLAATTAQRQNIIVFSGATIQNSFVNDSIALGGAVYIQCSADSPLRPPTPEIVPSIPVLVEPKWNRSCYSSLQDITFLRTAGAYGGAVAIRDGACSIRNVSIFSARAYVYGGAVYGAGSVELNLQSVVIENTTSDIRIGSALYTESIAALNMVNSTILSAGIKGEDNIVYALGTASVSLGNSSVRCAAGSTLQYSSSAFRSSVLPWSEEPKTTCCALRKTSITCSSCESPTYSFTEGVLHNTTIVSNAQCKTAPYGSVSSGGTALKASPHFWGMRSLERDSGAAMYLCPAGYCCPGPTACEPYNFCAGNREGLLCGKCKSGYSQLYSSTACVRDEDCKKTLFFVLSVLYAVVVWLVSFRSTSREPTVFTGVYSIVVTYYQIFPLLLVGSTEATILAPWITDFSSAKVPSEHSQSDPSRSSFMELCPVEGLGAVGKVLVVLVNAVFVFVATAILSILHYSTGSIWPSTDCERKKKAFICVVSVLRFVYLTFAVSVTKLASCTWVEGKKRLFIDGTIDCYQAWQYPLFGIIGLLGYIPIHLTYKLFQNQSRLCNQENQSANPNENQPSSLLIQEVTNKLTQSFRPGYKHWAGLDLGRRVAFALVFSLESNVMFRATGLAILCIVVLTVESVVRPYQSNVANGAQIASDFLLVLVALVNLRSASFVSAGIVPEGPQADFSNQLESLQSALLLSPAIVLALSWVARKLFRQTASKVHERKTVEVEENEQIEMNSVH